MKFKVGHSNNSLNLLDTEYKRIKVFEKEELFLQPESIVLNYADDSQLNMKITYGQYISLESIFKTFL